MLCTSLLEAVTETPTNRKSRDSMTTSSIVKTLAADSIANRMSSVFLRTRRSNITDADVPPTRVEQNNDKIVASLTAVRNGSWSHHAIAKSAPTYGNHKVIRIFKTTFRSSRLVVVAENSTGSSFIQIASRDSSKIDSVGIGKLTHTNAICYG